MYLHDLDPVLLQLGPLEIRWYGLVYVLGFLGAAGWLFYLQKKKVLSLAKDEIWDFLFYIMLGVIVGSRVFMIFWEPQVYLYRPLNLFKIWEGGMSFHGGFVGSSIAGWLYCRKKKLSFEQMADILCVPAMLALAFGRLANFVNGELIGRPWNGKWCVVFPQYDETCRHPNMIYSFFQRTAVFGWLLWLSLKQKFSPGFIFWNFVLLEGVGRILMDFFREDTLYYGFSLGQWMSLGMVIVALLVFRRKYLKEWRSILAP